MRKRNQWQDEHIIYTSDTVNAFCSYQVRVDFLNALPLEQFHCGVCNTQLAELHQFELRSDVGTK